jgi:hypothetical protein
MTRTSQLLGIGLALVLPVQASLYGQAGDAGLAFLKLGTSARGIAMADAMVAHVSGSAATYYNPAGLSLANASDPGGQITLMHKEWFGDTRTEFLGAAADLGTSQAIGLSINATTVSDIEIRTRPGVPQGTFDARNYAIGLSYSHRISDNLRAGVTGKFLYEKILVDDAGGFGIDLGAQYQTSIQQLSFGAILANLGSMSALRSESTSLPALLRMGGAWEDTLGALSSDFMLASDYQLVFPTGQSTLSMGGELMFRNVFAARAGYTVGSEGRGFAAGVGVRYGIAGLDYAYAPLSSDLGNSHTFSLLLNL